ncbi:MAG: hypothetical protein HXY53_01955 [Nitrospirae bacterium]|nr:hypothetical protein [Nitrospirota bacterium]
MAKDCECLKNCPFFNDKMANMPATAQMYKKRYCLDNNSECARYIVFKTLGRDKVPIDLFPNDLKKAKNLITVNQ